MVPANGFVYPESGAGPKGGEDPGDRCEAFDPMRNGIEELVRVGACLRSQNKARGDVVSVLDPAAPDAQAGVDDDLGARELRQ